MAFRMRFRDPTSGVKSQPSYYSSTMTSSLPPDTDTSDINKLAQQLEAQRHTIDDIGGHRDESSEQGPNGTQEPKGEQGPQGLKGEQGPQGPQGRSIKTLYHVFEDSDKTSFVFPYDGAKYTLESVTILGVFSNCTVDIEKGFSENLSENTVISSCVSLDKKNLLHFTEFNNVPNELCTLEIITTFNDVTGTTGASQFDAVEVTMVQK